MVSQAQRGRRPRWRVIRPVKVVRGVVVVVLEEGSGGWDVTVGPRTAISMPLGVAVGVGVGVGMVVGGIDARRRSSGDGRLPPLVIVLVTVLNILCTIVGVGVAAIAAQCVKAGAMISALLGGTAP